ncbi:hypothetical protein RvY_12635 [Ramazzottius varieornatus]|uniref:Tectonic domain-containing protein n=1 Tax=Ramazzottius varieornatus TaxID=947166 RepID=A0A1D1VM63_RAMVA|nr:hypothetical protein RvY_12635 [Ramazzottius varieornatus]
MKLLAFLLLPSLISARRESGSSLGFDRDTPRRGSDRQRDSADSSSTLDLPQFVRVEIEIQRLENPGAVLATGKACKFFSGACDPSISAFLDSNSPLSPFPGAALPVEQWPKIFSQSNTNSPTIGKSVNKDICGGALDKVNLRVHAVDSNTLLSDSLLANFDCPFSINARDIAKDANTATWGESTECRNTNPNSKIRLFARQRAYQIPPNVCRSDSSLALDSASAAGGKRDGQHDFIRIEFQVIQLLNPQGITADGKKCSHGFSSTCNPKITVLLDTEKPLAAWPGAKTVPNYDLLSADSGTNSPVINKNVGKNVCGGSVRQVNLRAHVVDVGTISSEKLIGDFHCLFTVDYRQVAASQSSSDWSGTQDCQNLQPNNDIRLQYRFRVFDITPAQCGIGTTTPASSFLGSISNIFGG